MSIGPTSPQPDLTYGQAIELAQRDYARIMHVHDVSWQTDLACSTVFFRCSCDDAARNPEAMRQHILTAVRKARGPVRSK